MSNIVQKGLSISLALIFSLSPVIAAAAGNSPCQNMVPMNADMKAHHISAPSTDRSMNCCSGGGVLQPPLKSSASAGPACCCSGSQSRPCDLRKGDSFDVTGYTLLTAKPGQHDTPFAGVVIAQDLPGHRVAPDVGLNLYGGSPYRSTPIYLHTLSLLC